MNTYNNYLKCSNSIFKFLQKNDNGYSIFHYTSPDGLSSIIQNGKLRFTDRFFLNDESEGIYVLELLAKEFDLIIDKTFPLSIIKDDIIKQCKDYKQTITTYQFKIYQISFSLDRDSLCMWNYYTKGNDIRGYNIEFNPKEICEKLNLGKDKKAPYILNGKVIYDRTEQITEVKKLLNSFYDAILLDYNNDVDEAIKFFKKHLSCILQRLTLLGTFFKSEYFKIENEYRIALDLNIDESGHTPNIDAKRKFMSKKDFFVPYYDIDFDRNAIKSITLSPTIDRYEGRKNVKMLLDEQEMKAVDIKQSQIPVRF